MLLRFFLCRYVNTLKKNVDDAAKKSKSTVVDAKVRKLHVVGWPPHSVALLLPQSYAKVTTEYLLCLTACDGGLLSCSSHGSILALYCHR